MFATLTVCQPLALGRDVNSNLLITTIQNTRPIRIPTQALPAMPTDMSNQIERKLPWHKGPSLYIKNWTGQSQHLNNNRSHNTNCMSLWEEPPTQDHQWMGVTLHSISYTPSRQRLDLDTWRESDGKCVELEGSARRRGRRLQPVTTRKRQNAGAQYGADWLPTIGRGVLLHPPHEVPTLRAPQIRTNPTSTQQKH